MRITSADDERLAPFRAVADPERIRTQGLFVAEGRRVVETLLARGEYDVRGVLLTQAAAEALSSRLPEGLEPLVVDGPAVLRDVTGYRFHQGCLALAALPETGNLEGRGVLEDGADPRLVVVLEGITDPDNVGTLFRSARAFDAALVLLGPGCAHPLYRKALRTSLGTALDLPFASSTTWPEDLDRLRAAGYAVLALTPRSGSRELDACVAELDTKRIAVLLGSEERGLSEAALARAEAHVRIVHGAGIDSLNVAAAGAIALHAVHARLRRTR